MVAMPGGAEIPLGQVMDIGSRWRPPMIKSDTSRSTSWFHVGISGVDVET
jgi:Cu(I)/Ag(I) efflux system membrane protein CusA/SilA